MASKEKLNEIIEILDNPYLGDSWEQEEVWDELKDIVEKYKEMRSNLHNLHEEAATGFMSQDSEYFANEIQDILTGEYDE